MAELNKENWLQERSSGVLAHISSLPGEFGIGNIGSPARAFIDFLAEAGFRQWQICPIGPTGYGDSPYQAFSSFAGNPYFLDLHDLVQEELLEDHELEPLRALPETEVDYGRLYSEFWTILNTAYQRFRQTGEDRFQGTSYRDFCERHAHWLDAYATFMALKAHHGGSPWIEWESGYRDFSGLDLKALPDEILEMADSHRFYQFLFFHQWKRLRDYARSRKISIIGDLPIFVPLDSADTWQFPQVFKLDDKGRPKVVAGVPPDYFSETGQYWGNPIYDWDYLRQTGYQWWAERLGFSFKCCDILRLDHFRAFDSYWEIPSWTDDARKGVMCEGPGMDFFAQMDQKLPKMPIIAEDLGYITEGVVQLRHGAGFPGMKILQFGYGHDDNNVNLPHFYPRDSVVYTGTHDNDTTRGWLNSISGANADKIRRYYRLEDGDLSAWPVIEAGFASVSRMAIFPLQDLLDLGSEARLNRPGTAGDNWKWRVTAAQLEQLRKDRLEQILFLQALYDRNGDSRQREYSAPPSETTLERH